MNFKPDVLVDFLSRITTGRSGVTAENLHPKSMVGSTDPARTVY
jgi:hypothetical protein